jgi:PAS domain-containing protein
MELRMPLAPLRVLREDPDRPAVTPASTLARWGATVAAAEDACLLLDPAGRVVSVSPAGAGLLGQEQVGLLDRSLLEAVTFVDFESGGAAPAYTPRIPPLLACSADTLTRGIARVRTAAGPVTLDMVSAPLRRAQGQLVGSITFLARVSAG